MTSSHLNYSEWTWTSSYSVARQFDQAVIRMCVDREPPDLSDTAVDMLAMCSNALKFDPLAEIKERFAREEVVNAIMDRVKLARIEGTDEITATNEECAVMFKLDRYGFHQIEGPNPMTFMGCKVTLSTPT